MKVLFLATGTELIDGTTSDTNSMWLAREFERFGAQIEQIWVVRDDPAEIEALLNRARDRFDLVVVCGGLGPTSDDVTVECVSRVFRRPLVFDKAVYRQIKARLLFLKKAALLRLNRKQAMIPRGIKVLQNSAGTAPGLRFDAGKTCFFVLPGVPHEFRVMAMRHLISYMKGKMRNVKQRVFLRLLKVFPLAEASLEGMIRGLKLPAGVEIGFRAAFPENHVKIVGRGASLAAARTLVQRAETLIRRRLKHFVFGADADELWTVVFELLLKNKKTMTFVESCTGGLVASLLTKVPGSSKVFLRSYVTYDYPSKMNMVGVSAKTLDRYGAVSKQCALEMCEGGLARSQADMAVAITGVAGPSGGSRQKPVGTVFIGVACRNRRTTVRRFQFRGEREAIQKLSAYWALDLVRHELM